MKGLVKFLQKIEPDKKKSPFLHTLFDGLFTFLYVPDAVTSNGVHVRDGMDLKRTMIMVVLALQLCYVFGMYNIGHQHFLALGMHTGFLEAIHLKLSFGLVKILPIFIVTHIVGLGIEFYFAAKKGHAIEEGFLVSGALIPLIMPPDIPLWMLGFAVFTAVLIGKEAFGGTGMNILNVALFARAIIFFAYPTTISGDEVWIAGFEKISSGVHPEYGFIFTDVLNPIFSNLGWAVFDTTQSIVDGFTGATPLALAAKGGIESLSSVYSFDQMLWGGIPGSIGETGKPLIIVGSLMLIILGIASWRIMAGMIIGLVVTGLLFNAWGATPFMTVPWYYHFIMGSFLFAMAFMATDPVTASGTNIGKWIYGLLIGCIGVIIRVMNPAYPEGWMLAILLLNVFAPLIDHFILESNIKKRLNRA